MIRYYFKNALPCFLEIFFQELNNFRKFSLVIEATNSTEIFLISAIFSATYFTYFGSLVFPRKGIGAKYGESVSINILSSGTYFATSTNSIAFLKVTIPEKEI